MPKRMAVCVACFVTLPKTYHKILVEFADPFHFSHQHFSNIVYSFLVVPVCCEAEAKFLVKLIERCKILDIQKKATS